MHLLLTVISSRVLAESSFEAHCVENLNPKPGIEQGAPKTFQYPDLVLFRWQVVTLHPVQHLFTSREVMLLTVISNRVLAGISFKARAEILDPKSGVEHVHLVHHEFGSLWVAGGNPTPRKCKHQPETRC